MVGDDWKDGGAWSRLSCGACESEDLSTSTRSKKIAATSKTAMTEMRFLSKPPCWQPVLIGMRKALAGRRLAANGSLAAVAAGQRRSLHRVFGHRRRRRIILRPSARPSRPDRVRV